MSQDPRSPRVLGKKNTKTPTSSPSVKVTTTTAKMRSDAKLEGGGRSSPQTEGDGDNSQLKRNLTSPLAEAKVWAPAGLLNYALDEKMLQNLIDAGGSATAPATRSGASSSAVYHDVDKGDDDGNTSAPGTQHVKSGALGLGFKATPAETAGGGGGGQRADNQRQPRSSPVVMATMHGKRGRDGSSSGTAQKMETSLAQQGHHELKTVGGSNAGNGRVPRRPSVQAKEEGEEDDMPPTDGGSVEGTLAVASSNSTLLKAQVSSSPSTMPPPGVKDEVAPSWKGKWSQYEPEGLGVTLPDRIRSMAVPQDVAASLEALCVHYPWIVYLGYVFWRKLLVQFWLPRRDNETELARNSCWVFTNPSNLDAGLPSPTSLRLGILGDLRAFSSEMLHPIVLEENASVGSPLSSKRTHSKNNHQIRLTIDHMKQNLSNSSFGQFLDGLMLADQIDLVRLLVDQLGLDLSESWVAWPRESGGANSGSIIELSLRAPRSRIPSMLLKMKRTPAIGLTLIHVAACNGQKAMVEFLYQQDPTLAKETDNSGWTPMHIAAIYGQRDVVEFLYQQDPTLAKEKDNDDWTPMHVAAIHGHKDIVEFLYQQDPTLAKEKDWGDWTPMHYAANFGQKDIVEFLYQQDPTLVKDKGNDDWTPMHIAARVGHKDVVELLFQKDPTLAKEKDDGGWTPMHHAASDGAKDSVEFLYQQDPTLAKEKGNGGRTPMHVAARHGHKEIVEFLYQQDPTLAKEKGNGGRTPMHVAARRCHKEIVEFLYQQDPTLAKEKDVDGETPMHIAARNDHKDVVEFLFQQGLSLP